MITAKFGGTAMAPQNFHCVKRLVGQHHGCVVVSAIGREFLGDVKTTDLLKRHFYGDEKAWQRVEQKYKKLVMENGVNVDVEKLLYESHKKSALSLAHCMSLGEELSAKITAAYLGCPYVEADRSFSFDERGNLKLALTKRNLKSAFSGLKLGVIGGFYGGSSNGRVLFSRGGSDVTGSVCAVALRSTLYENWTDVNGVCVANPKDVANAETVANLSYGEMYRLAKGGAEVLHPSAVKVAQRAGLPIKVGNYLDEKGLSTLVCNCPSGRAFLSVTQRKSKNGVVTTILHGMSFAQVCARLQKIARQAQQQKLFGKVQLLHDNLTFQNCKITENCVEICTQCSILPLVYKVFSEN